MSSAMSRRDDDLDDSPLSWSTINLQRSSVLFDDPEDGGETTSDVGFLCRKQLLEHMGLVSRFMPVPVSPDLN
jgi:hypothetical protein